MKWYLAARTRHTNKMVEIAKFLQSKGQKISSSWIYIDEPLRPFLQNLERVREISVENVKALLDTDVFLLFNDLEGVDIFIEMGVCLGLKESGKNIKIYVVGDYDKTSFTQLHPSIVHCKSLQEVLDLEKIDYTNFEIPVL